MPSSPSSLVPTLLMSLGLKPHALVNGFSVFSAAARSSWTEDKVLFASPKFCLPSSLHGPNRPSACRASSRASVIALLMDFFSPGSLPST